MWRTRWKPNRSSTRRTPLRSTRLPREGLARQRLPGGSLRRSTRATFRYGSGDRWYRFIFSDLIRSIVEAFPSSGRKIRPRRTSSLRLRVSPFVLQRACALVPAFLTDHLLLALLPSHGCRPLLHRGCKTFWQPVRPIRLAHLHTEPHQSA